MPIDIITERATPEQIQTMLLAFPETRMIKIVVDVQRRRVAGGGDMHYEGESALLEDGSSQEDLWGANWYPDNQQIEFESLINIRPRQNNRSVVLQDPALRQLVEIITRERLGEMRP
jgi:hypothetical protein